MYIEPNTVIKILHNVPLDNTYEHTIYFEDEALRQVYFNTKVKYTLNKQSYQRLQRGFMRVDIQAENLYDCNYLMYQNTAFGNKWFYAFIKGVEYINNAVSQIEFEIDVMQTWHDEYTLDYCFVEREHSMTDGLFENIIEEDINIGDEYVCNARDTFDMNAMSVCALINKNLTGGQQGTGRTINNIYTPMRVISGYNVQNPTAIDSALNNYQEAEIVGVYQYPTVFDNNLTGEIQYIGKVITPNVPTNQQTATIDGYTPKNKKLYSYPYNFLIVSNNAGTVATYRWEDWRDGYIGNFKIGGVTISLPEVICFPVFYRGYYEGYDDGVVLSNFPQCAWSGDMFKAWWAQHQASFEASVQRFAYGQATSGVFSAASGGILGIARGVSELVQGTQVGVKEVLGTIKDIQNTPSQTYGHTQTQTLNAGAERIQFDFYSMSIKRQYAEIIDSYFDRFGYATKKTKIPNRNVRPHWTYTKTVSCTISGSVPADDMNKICRIYDNGITFWKYGSEVGNYSLDNRANPV